ncbi:MAG: hypothetical protein ACREQH_15920, partial [Candidatus Binatus sp.]
PQLFNTASVRPGTYNVAEILLDSNNPGTLIPNCPKAPPPGSSNSSTADGCINYPIAISNGAVITAPIGGLSAGPGKLAQLFLQVSVTIDQAPTTPGGAYTVSVTITTPTNPPELGTVTGSVTVMPGSGSGSSTTAKIRKLAVTAQAIGTNTPIATAELKSGNGCAASSPGGCFTLILPAASGPAAPGFGTLYDLAVAGGGDSYATDRLVPLYPTQPIDESFTVTSKQTLGNITGQVNDGCVAGKAIAGATLQLLIPPQGNPNITDADCFNPNTADECVAVAAANTDNAGGFPLPGTITIPSEFQNVPVRSKSLASQGAYVMEVSAPGYNDLFVYAIPGTGGNKAGGTCSTDGGVTFNACKLTMTTGYITGQFPIIPPPAGQTTLVQVFAEDHDSNNIESALPMPVSVTNASAGGNPVAQVGYTLNVPSSIPAAAFDLFASTIDLYQGSVDPYQGHNIVAISNVPAPAACATVTAPTPSSADPSDTSRVIGCVGHGSITGIVGNPNLGNSVVLEKIAPDAPPDDNEVQITNAIVQNQQPNSSPSNNYAFCAPADAYQVQKFELPTPVESATPVAAPTSTAAGDPVSVTIMPAPIAGGPTPSPGPTPTGSPVPTPTATPNVKCPTTCSNRDGSCPGICNNAAAPSL